MKRMLLHMINAAGLATLLFVLSTVAAQSQGTKASILVLVDAEDALVVDYRTTGNTVRQLILLGGLLEAGIGPIRESGHSRQLRESVGIFDRVPVFQASLEATAATQSKYSTVTVMSKATSSKIARSGYSAVIEIEEVFAGMISAWRLSTLSASTTVKYNLESTKSGKRLAKGSISGYAQPVHEFKEGVSGGDTFRQEYQQAVQAAINTIWGQFSKDGHLTTVANEAGITDYVPALDRFLKEYSNKFDYSVKTPKGWNVVDMGTKYVTVLAPKGADRALFGLRLDIDLLIPELGQEVDDMDAYVGLFNGRVTAVGYKRDSAAAPLFTLPETHRHVTYIRPDGKGRDVIVFIPLGKEYVGIYSVVILDNYAQFVSKYRNEIESTFTSLTFKANP